MIESDWVALEFRGDGLELPTDEERDRADAIVARFALQWREEYQPIPRIHDDVSDEGFANYLAGMPTNRAFLRSRLRRWWRKP